MLCIWWIHDRDSHCYSMMSKNYRKIVLYLFNVNIFSSWGLLILWLAILPFSSPSFASGLILEGNIWIVLVLIILDSFCYWNRFILVTVFRFYLRLLHTYYFLILFLIALRLIYVLNNELPYFIFGCFTGWEDLVRKIYNKCESPHR